MQLATVPGVQMRPLAAEAIGSAFLVAGVIGSAAAAGMFIAMFQ